MQAQSTSIAFFNSPRSSAGVDVVFCGIATVSLCAIWTARLVTGNCMDRSKPFVVPPLGGRIDFRLKPVLRTRCNEACNFLVSEGIQPNELPLADASASNCMSSGLLFRLTVPKTYRRRRLRLAAKRMVARRVSEGMQSNDLSPRLRVGLPTHQQHYGKLATFSLLSSSFDTIKRRTDEEGP